jgi:phage gp46-like protein
MILSELDSVVSQKDIERYFETNKSSFSLQDYLVTALYIKIPKGVKVEDKIKIAFLLKNDKDLTQVNSYAKLYAENFYFDDEQWIYFNELTKDIPLKQYNIDNIVLNRTKTYFSDDEYTYFLNIIDYRLKDEVPPLEFLKPQIKEIILSKRVNNLREKQENKLLQSIKTKHDIKIHYH